MLREGGSTRPISHDVIAGETVVDQVDDAGLRSFAGDGLEDRISKSATSRCASGKSTLVSSIIRLLPGNDEVTGGEIMFNGRDLLRLSEREMRSLRGDRIAMIFQDPMTSLNSVRTIGQQMADVQHRMNRSAREKRDRSAEMLGRVGIPDPLSRLDPYPHQFSGGMRQRIATAMALMVEPDLLIADDPTTAPDATLEVQIIRLHARLQQDIGCSILFVTHHLGVVAELWEDVLVMYAGEVAERGTVRDIFHRPAHPWAPNSFNALILVAPHDPCRC